MLIEAGALAIAGGAGFLAWQVRGRSSSLFGPSAWRGDRTRNLVALTFDDGPSESTPELLDVLDSVGVRATFFLVGRNVRRLPAVARKIRAAGHEIGNHSDSHVRLDFRSPEFIYRELALAQESIKQTTGTTPAYFRAPYGVRWFGLRQALERLHLSGVMWTAIGLDWKLSAEQIRARLSRAAENGAIFCLHDGRGLTRQPDIRPTIEAVRGLAADLRSRGFEFATIAEILCPHPRTPSRA